MDNKNWTDHITTLSAEVKDIFTAINEIMASVNDGDRIEIATLISKVAKKTGRDEAQIKPLVSYYTHNVEQFGVAFVRPGKFGGVVKGVRQTKSSKKLPIATSSTTEIELDDEE